MEFPHLGEHCSVASCKILGRFAFHVEHMTLWISLTMFLHSPASRVQVSCQGTGSSENFTGGTSPSDVRNELNWE